jgi:hypothetical protein
MDTLYIDYDDSLIGRTPYVDAYNFFGTNPGGPNQLKALSCFRYAIERMLQWDVDTAILKFDEYMIDLMKLTKLLMYIDFPPEVPYGNVKYILSLLYPQKVRVRTDELVQETYKEVLNSNGKQFPREYFSGGAGFKRFCQCVKYLLDNYLTLPSIEAIYEFFMSPRGKKFLYDYRLKVPADQFSISMFEVVRYITRDDEDSDMYYCYYSFCQELCRVTNGTTEEEEPVGEEYDVAMDNDG